MRRTAHCLVILVLLGLSLSAMAQELKCAACGRRISGNYLRASDGRVFCNRTCFNQTLPQCAVCKTTITGRHFPHEGKHYCSEKCLSTLFPSCQLCGMKTREWTTINAHRFCPTCATRERCTECRLPFREGERLKDGRAICEACRKQSVTDERQTNALFLQARAKLETIVGRKMEAPPALKLVGLPELYSIMGRKAPDKDSNALLRGFYSRQQRTTVRGKQRNVQVTRTVYLLYGMTNSNILVTSVHENTHDYMAQFFPKSKDAPLWLQEGVAQYTAAIFARQQRYLDKLEQIEAHPDPDYGGGYRFFKEKFGDNNWPAAAKWLSATDLTALPQECPVK